MSYVVFAAALLPFIAASIYMSFKPVPERAPRTHGGDAGIPYADAGFHAAETDAGGAMLDTSDH
jgi:hypothetical protein